MNEAISFILIRILWANSKLKLNQFKRVLFKRIPFVFYDLWMLNLFQECSNQISVEWNLCIVLNTRKCYEKWLHSIKVTFRMIKWCLNKVFESDTEHWIWVGCIDWNQQRIWEGKKGDGMMWKQWHANFIDESPWIK